MFGHEHSSFWNLFAVVSGYTQTLPVGYLEPVETPLENASPSPTNTDEDDDSIIALSDDAFNNDGKNMKRQLPPPSVVDVTYVADAVANAIVPSDDVDAAMAPVLNIATRLTTSPVKDVALMKQHLATKKILQRVMTRLSLPGHTLPAMCDDDDDLSDEETTMNEGVVSSEVSLAEEDEVDEDIFLPVRRFAPVTPPVRRAPDCKTLDPLTPKPRHPKLEFMTGNLLGVWVDARGRPLEPEPPAFTYRVDTSVVFMPTPANRRHISFACDKSKFS